MLPQQWPGWVGMVRIGRDIPPIEQLDGRVGLVALCNRATYPSIACPIPYRLSTSSAQKSVLTIITRCISDQSSRDLSPAAIVAGEFIGLADDSAVWATRCPRASITPHQRAQPSHEPCAAELTRILMAWLPVPLYLRRFVLRDCVELLKGICSTISFIHRQALVGGKQI